MGGLIRKELRSLRPFLALAIFLPVIGFIYELLTGPPHMRPLADTVEEYVAGSREGSIVIFVMIFALASGLLVREYDEGTMEFLDALPVSRSRIFFTKVLLSLLVPLILTLLDIGTSVALHALSQHSLDDGFHWAFLTTALLLRLCQAFIFLSLGLALSFLRRFGWLLVGVLFWGYLLVHEVAPAIGILDLFAVTQPNYEGLRWIVSWKQLGVQMALAGILLVVAYALFLGSGDRLLRSYHRVQERHLGRVFLLGGGVMIAVVGFALFLQAYRIFEAEEEGVVDPDSDIRIVYPSWSTSRTTTEHYEFLYPNNLTRRSQKVVTAAERVHGEVQAFLGAEPGPRIVVDMTGSLGRHAGLAHWEKVQMDLNVSEDAEVLQSILGHETTHVYLDRLSDSRLSDVFGSARFFHEGVASYVEYRLLRPDQDLDRLWSVAAVMRARKQVDFAELVDDQRLRARLDTYLVYPLGEIFVEALVDAYGSESAGTIARALARDDAPDDLSGQELWRDVFQACDYNLETVIDTFYAKLDEQVDQHRELIEMLPRVRGAVEIEDDLVVVRAVWEPIEGWHPVCRFRQAEDTPDRQYIFRFGNEADEFRVSLDTFPDGVCWYQLGLSDGEERVIYEPWLKVPLWP